ncbi:MAG: sugar porter family MFS transporter [Gammaproteobacteria bacterium]|nr:sugar porter family MFS transporter [Gammaproteobacteria bacterium]
MNKHNLTRIIFISCVATIGGFLFGFDSGVINGTVEGLQTSFMSNSVGTGFSVASMLIGCAVGAFFAGWLADHFGRKRMLVVAAVLFIVSAWGSGIASGSIEFMIYRILGGLAVGAASVMTPAYIAEIAPSAIRGRLATIQQVAIIFGLFLAFLSNYVIADIAGGSTQELWWGFQAWRWMFWIELIPATIFLLALFLIPESPRYLVIKGDHQVATKVLSSLMDQDGAHQTVSDIKRSLSNNDEQPKLSDLVDPSTGRIRQIVWIGIGLASFQQLVGINVVFYYGAVLWQAVGFSEADALLTNVISGLLSIGAVLIALALIDKVGRKPLLLIGSIGMTITLGTVAFAFSTGELTDTGLQLSDNMGILALVAANAYVAFFNFSWGPVMWVMLGEMFPNQIRGAGLAVSGLCQWSTNFLITMTFPILLTAIGLSITYVIYSTLALLSVLFVIKLVKETKGLSLEEMN